VPPRWFFPDFSGFGADFFQSQKTSKKHLLPERSEILKIRRPGYFWSHFGRFLDQFWRPFFVDFPDRLNLVICNTYNAKTSFLQFKHQKSIKKSCFFIAVSWTSFFSFFLIFFKNGRFWDPHSKSDGRQNGTDQVA
jgi:hypothetical protein